jgi:hypothetical protein
VVELGAKAQAEHRTQLKQKRMSFVLHKFNELVSSSDDPNMLSNSTPHKDGSTWLQRNHVKGRGFVRWRQLHGTPLGGLNAGRQGLERKRRAAAITISLRRNRALNLCGEHCQVIR